MTKSKKTLIGTEPRIDEATGLKRYDHLPAEVRLELLVGDLAEMLAPVREMVAAIRLLANASVTTRSKLELLLDLTDTVWRTFHRIQQDAKEDGLLRGDLDD
jgi:hypothetical protein